MKSVNSPRKEAKQDRSRATVDAILEAAARILARDDDRLTTNVVAQIAGVSIGSLYQYFPGKDAILAALIRRVMRSRTAIVRLHLDEARSLSLEDAVRKMVRDLSTVRIRTKFEQALFRAFLRHGDGEMITVVDRELLLLVREWLVGLDHKTRPLDVDVASFVLFQSVRAVFVAASIERPELLHDESFREEVSSLVLSYIAPRKK